LPECIWPVSDGIPEICVLIAWPFPPPSASWVIRRVAGLVAGAFSLGSVFSIMVYLNLLCISCEYWFLLWFIVFLSIVYVFYIGLFVLFVRC
jgi:hypothetical protein